MLGAQGQLGLDLSRECVQRGHDLTALGHRELDIADRESVFRRIAEVRPAWVLNAAAYNSVDQAEAEPEAAMRVNAAAVGNLADASATVDAALVHYSTDYVFGGDKTSPYVESDPANPLSAYGKSKLLGESVAREAASRHYVLRLAGVFGPGGRRTKRGNFLEFVLRRCALGLPLRIVHDRHATPTFAPAVAERSLDMLEQRVDYGTYHLGGGEAVTWCDFARRIVRLARCNREVEAVSYRDLTERAQRPVYAALSNAKAESAGVRAMPALDDAIRLYLQERDRA